MLRLGASLLRRTQPASAVPMLQNLTIGQPGQIEILHTRGVGNMHAARQPFDDGAIKKKFGLARRAKRYRVTKRYKRENKQGPRTSDGRMMQQYQEQKSRQLVHLSDETTPDGEMAIGGLEHVTSMCKLSSYLYDYYRTKYRNQKTPEEIVQFLTTSEFNEDDLKLIAQGQYLEKTIRQSQSAKNSNVLLNPDVDVDRPLPRGFGNLSATNVIGQFQYDFISPAGKKKNPTWVRDFLNSEPGIGGRDALHRGHEEPENGREEEEPFMGVLRNVRKCYKEVHNLLNTEPHWRMHKRNDTIWSLNDNVTRRYFDEAITDFVNNKRTVEMEIMDIHKFDIMDSAVTYIQPNTKHALRFLQVLVITDVTKRLAIYNRFGKLVYGDEEPRRLKEVCVFEIPATVMDCANRRWRLHYMNLHPDCEYYERRPDTNPNVEFFNQPQHTHPHKSERTETTWSARSAEYEQSLIQIATDAYGKDSGATLHQTTNINFPLREDVRWVQAKKAQANANEEAFDHVGSPMTTSYHGHMGMAEWKKMLQIWARRSSGFRTGIVGRGKGERQLYMARMLRGSVGDKLDLKMKQYIGRKRVQVFTKRITGRLALPKPAVAFVEPPPGQPIGWNTDKQGMWKSSEPYAQFPRARMREFKPNAWDDGETGNQAGMAKFMFADVNKRDYQKGDDHAKAFMSKRWHTKSEVKAARALRDAEAPQSWNTKYQKAVGAATGFKKKNL